MTIRETALPSALESVKQYIQWHPDASLDDALEARELETGHLLLALLHVAGHESLRVGQTGEVVQVLDMNGNQLAKCSVRGGVLEGQEANVIRTNYQIAHAIEHELTDGRLVGGAEFSRRLDALYARLKIDEKNYRLVLSKWLAAPS